MAFIVLTLLEDGEPVHINCDHIIALCTCDLNGRDGTHVVLTDDYWCNVKESQESIIGLVKWAKINERSLLQ